MWDDDIGHLALPFPGSRLLLLHVLSCIMRLFLNAQFAPNLCDIERARASGYAGAEISGATNPRLYPAATLQTS